MKPSTLQAVWIAGFVAISLGVLLVGGAMTVMLLMFKVPPENKDAVILVIGGLNGLLGVIVKAWIDNPFDNEPSVKTGDVQHQEIKTQ